LIDVVIMNRKRNNFMNLTPDMNSRHYKEVPEEFIPVVVEIYIEVLSS